MQDSKEEVTRKKFSSDKWEFSYNMKDKSANGLFLFNQMLEFQTKKTSGVIKNNFDSSSFANPNTAYFFIGKQFELQTEEFDSILLNIEKGASLFIAYEALSENINAYFFDSEILKWEYNSYLDIYISKKNRRLYNVNQADTTACGWNLFNHNYIKQFGDGNYKKEASHLNSPISISYILGKGNIYLHCNPKLFVNYQLLSNDGFAFSQYFVEKIPKNHLVKWLEIAKLKELELEDEGTGEKDKSMLQFIFNSKALTVALLISGLGLILFLIFRTKRSMPFIPYLQKTQNNSLIFAETVKEIYFKKQSPYQLLQLMKKNFYSAVSKQFFVDLSKPEKREQSLASLLEKSKYSAQNIQELIEKLENTNEKGVDFNYLERVSKLQQEFYLNAAIISKAVSKKTESKERNINRKIFLPLLLIFVGIALCLSSFYFLHKSIGGAVSLLPISIFCLVIGIRMFSLPLLKIKGNQLTFYKLYKARIKISISELQKIEIFAGETQFHLNENIIITLNNNDISLFDKNYFEQFISPYLIKNL
jgi:hypothetical protein